jgi:two-component system LytT family response regulator
MTRPLRVLIVDDEQLAREGLRAIVEAEPGVAAEVCANGTEAAARLEAGDVDVLLVVFVTAYDQFAVKAFDASATDYVVKPYADARIRSALARARRQVEQRQVGAARAALAGLLTMVGGGLERRPADRIAVRSVGKVSFVRVADITWIGAADYYAELHTRDGKAHLVRETMQRLESRLDPEAFARVHRTVIVRLDQVLEIRSVGTDRSAVVLRDGTKLPLSRSRREALEARLAEA